ncbi:MAG: hypothetical protein DSY94_08190 [SAR324 cluster bacterium]|uniref:Uncharacterized protein n=1 Tax=SAR324 cluster bacterium TaxID=2024889 RepID=A0A432GI49_9DELT|nr:MAG: hypothetical protein DSY94_08190 [SAR324 cluster bacterium]
MDKLIKEVPQCKHHKKKKLKPNEFWSPNPFEMYKKTDDSDSKEERKKRLKLLLPILGGKISITCYYCCINYIYHLHFHPTLITIIFRHDV